MRYLLMIMALSAGLVFSACQTAQTQTVKNTKPTPPANNVQPDDGAPRISLADAKADFDAGSAVFIDTRPEDTYKQEHVKGAINITLMDDAAKYSSIPKGKKIIVYCS
jgi:hypothetical protein